MLYCPNCRRNPDDPRNERNKDFSGIVHIGKMEQRTRDSWESFGKCGNCSKVFKVTMIEMEQFTGACIVKTLAKGVGA